MRRDYFTLLYLVFLFSTHLLIPCSTTYHKPWCPQIHDGATSSIDDPVVCCALDAVLDNHDENLTGNRRNQFGQKKDLGRKTLIRSEKTV